MNSIRSIAAQLALITLAPFLLGEIATTHLPLEVSQAHLNHSVEFSTGGAASARPNAQTLYLSANIEWDTETLEPLSVIFYNSTIAVNGGIRWDDYTLSVDTRLAPPGSPTVASNWTFSFNGLTVFVTPDIERVDVSNSNGDLDVNLSIYRGTATTEFTAFGDTLSETINLAQSLTPIPLSKPPRIRIERLANSLTSTGYAFHFDFEFYEKTTEHSPELGTTITAIDQGSLTLTGIQIKPTRFANWHGNKGRSEYPTAERGALSSSGVPIELAYALNLHMRFEPSHYPISFKLENGSPTLRVLSNGLNEDVHVEYSRTLTPGSWLHVPSAWLENGDESLKQDSNLPIAATVPENTGPVYLRIRPDLSNL